MTPLPSEVLEYIATLEPLPKGLSPKEQWRRVAKVRRYLAVLWPKSSDEDWGRLITAVREQMRLP